MAGFKSTERYIASRDLEVAVNASVTLQRPLLIKGEPGTGKTVLAHEVAQALGHQLIEWHIKSTTKAQQGLYEYDAVSRLRDGQLGDPRVHEIGNYIVRGKLWDAFDSDQPVVVLIGRSSSSPRTTKKNCQMHSCAAASSTISASPTVTRCSKSSTHIIPIFARTWRARR